MEPSDQVSFVGGMIMLRKILVMAVVFSLVLLMVTGVRATSSLPEVTENSDWGVRYHLFDEQDAQIPALLDSAMKIEKIYRWELVSVKDKIPNYNALPVFDVEYHGEVLNAEPKVNPAVYWDRTARIKIEYANENFKSDVSYAQIKDTGTLAGNAWAEEKRLYTENIQNNKKNYPAEWMVVENSTDNSLRFLMMDSLKSAETYNNGYYGFHVEKYGQCVIEITLGGAWKDHDQIIKAMDATLEHCRKLAKNAELHAADYFARFPPNLPTETSASETTTTGKPQPASEWQNVSGTLQFNARDSGSASPNQRLILSIYDEKGEWIHDLETKTDTSGRFNFNVSIMQGDLLKFSAPLSYHDAKGEMIFGVYDDRKTRDKPLVIECGGGEVRVSKDTNLNDVKLTLLEGKLLGQKQSDFDALNAVAFYQMMLDGVTFYQDQLSVKFEYALPVKVVLYSTQNAGHPNALAFYNPVDGDINILPHTSNFLMGSYPNIILHELAHGVMYDLYDRKFPGSGQADVNHGGYANASSADSLLEGFADFMAAIVAYHDEDSRDQAALEPNFLAWDNCGFSEELAVAGTLLDLCDSGAKDDDKVNLSLPTVWGILKTYCSDFKDFYLKLQQLPENTSKMADINQVFIDHGFYVVTDKLPDGIGTFQFNEAFRDTNLNQRYDQGEFIVDFNAIKDGQHVMEYKPGYVPGWAAYPDNPTREYSPVLPWHSIRTSTTHLYFEAKVTFPDHPELDYTCKPDNIAGNIYVPVPPVAYKAMITLSARGEGIKSQDPVVIKAADFYADSANAMARGYYIEHDFKVKLKGGSSSLVVASVVGSIVLLLVLGGIFVVQKRKRKEKS